MNSTEGTRNATKAALNCQSVYTDARPFFSCNAGHEWYFEETRELIEITIRGSDSPTTLTGIKDWIRNIDVTPTMFHGCRIVNGFHPGTLKAGFKQYNHSFSYLKPIRIYGHSQGGALAQTLSVELNAEGLNVEQVITFGSPRVSMDCLPFQWPVTNYQHGADPVVRMPIWRWKHSGECVRLGKWKWWPTRKAHKMESYIEELNRNV